MEAKCRCTNHAHNDTFIDVWREKEDSIMKQIARRVKERGRRNYLYTETSSLRLRRRVQYRT